MLCRDGFSITSFLENKTPVHFAENARRFGRIEAIIPSPLGSVKFSCWSLHLGTSRKIALMISSRRFFKYSDSISTDSKKELSVVVAIDVKRPAFNPLLGKTLFKKFSAFLDSLTVSYFVPFTKAISLREAGEFRPHLKPLILAYNTR